MYGTHTLAFQRIFVRMKIISLIFIRFSYVSLIRNSVTGPLIKRYIYRHLLLMLFSLLLLFYDDDCLLFLLFFQYFCSLQLCCLYCWTFLLLVMAVLSYMHMYS